MTTSHDVRPTLLAALAKELWSATLLGASTPEGAERFRRMQQPQLGDMVFVNHTRRDAMPAWLVGRYDSCWSYLGERVDNEWTGGGILIYGIETLDGEFVRWENVELLTLPPTLTKHLQTWRDAWVAAHV